MEDFEQQKKFFLDLAKKMEYKGEECTINYPGRRNHSNDSREYVANNKVAQKAIRDYLGLKR